MPVPAPSSAIPALMGAAEQGDGSAAEALFAALYSELHRLAKHELARYGWNATLSATTLLHETYLDLSARAGQSFPDRSRFMGYAARAMRGLIIDHARNRSAIKRGGQFEITSLADRRRSVLSSNSSRHFLSGSRTNTNCILRCPAAGYQHTPLITLTRPFTVV